MVSPKKKLNINTIESIEGFDIDLTQEKLKRIDRLVACYEKSIVARVDDEYTNSTKWADRFADKVATFGGS